SSEDRMNVHQNARLTPHSRAELVRRVVVEGQTPTAVAAAFGVTVKTVRKWVARFQTEAGSHGRDHRSPTPPALDGPAHRSRGRRLAGYGQPHPQAPRPQPHPGT